MRSKKWIRILSWVLSAAMSVGIMPIGVMAADGVTTLGAPKENLILHYNFQTAEDGKVIIDASGNDHDGKGVWIETGDSGTTHDGVAVKTESVEVNGERMNALVLGGGDPSADNTFVAMPDGVLNGLKSVTISCWVNVTKNGWYSRIWDIGLDTTTYMYLLESGQNDSQKGYTAAITNSGWMNEKATAKGSSLETEVWKLCTLTFNGTTKTMKLYENGVQVGDTVTTDIGLDVLENATRNYIGYGQFGDPMLNGKIADFRIYDYAMSADEIAEMIGLTDEERVALDKAALNLGNTSGLTEDLVLPGTGASGSIITWISSDASVITDAGVITRPAIGEPDTTATLTATITCGAASDSRDFTITVKAEQEVVPVEKGMILHYDFESLTTGTIVNDVSGNGKAGEVMPRGSGVQTKEVDIFGRTQTAIVLNGGQPGTGRNYVEMPTGVLNDLESVTISCWVYVTRTGSYSRIWDIGHNSTTYMYLLDGGGNAGHMGYTAALTARGWGNEKGPQKGTSLQSGIWKLTTVTFDGATKTMKMYEDGVQMGQAVTTDADLSVLEGSTQNWIGYGQFKNDILNGMIADFRIYNYAFTDEEAAALFAVPDEERVNRDVASLTLGDTSALTENLTLSTKGSAGSTIAWATDNEDVITAAGVITRPQPGMGNATAKLTAFISSGEINQTKVFNITVLALPTDQERVDADASAINLGSLSAVVENLILPTKGALESTISWSSSNPKHLATDGTVIRPIGASVTVTLTATITYNDAKATRTFNATIMPLYEKLDIVKAEDVAVTTASGIVPSLPTVVLATYEDGTTGMVKVIWPTNMKGANFTDLGTQYVIGRLVDSDVTVTATVTVVENVETPDAQAQFFDLLDISLDGTDSIYGQNMARALEYLKIMDADRMLYNFRNTFKQDTKGAKPLTGWDEPTGLLRGHSTGHFMSALAQAYASTGDATYKEKLDYMITEMRELQKLSQGKASAFKTICTPKDAAQDKWNTDLTTWGVGYIGAYSPDQFALLEQYTPYATIWAPYYTMHKLLAGFLDSYIYAGNETGLEIAKDLGLWVYDRLSACTQEQREQMWSMYIAGEYGGMNESLARLYEITEDERYLDASKMFDNADFFDGLAVNEDTIQNRHANQHIPQIVGAVHEYESTGESYYYNVAQHFWELTTARYAYSIGGVGTGERFKDPYKQGTNIHGNAGRGENCETCAAYNMLKLTRNLYIYDPDNAEYMDYYERTMLNQIAASQSQDTTDRMHNGVTYMLPIDPGQRRGYDSDYGSFTCCNGTGMENHVIYQNAAYAKTDDTLYVNLYMPTTADWEEKGISVTQETEFPSENIKLTVSGSGEFKMKLRVPYWATAGFTVTVNDEIICTNPTPSTYIEIDRAWQDGDVVSINMPYTLYLDKTPDTVNGDVVASLMYGPIVMVAKDDRSSYTEMNWYTLSLNDSNLSDAVEIVEPAGTGKTPHLVADGLDFYPMYHAYNYRYHAYVKLMDTPSALNPEYLQAVVDAATGENAPGEDDFGSEEDWVAFQNALTQAQQLLENLETATQRELYDVQIALEKALAKRNIVAVTGVKLDKSNSEVTVGRTLKLNATVEPSDATNKAVTWESSNASIATVVDGVITAEAVGTAIITVITVDGSKSASCVVTVKAKEPGGNTGSGTVSKYTITVKQTEGGVISPATSQLEKGESMTFTIEANEGYRVADVLVDGKSVGIVTTYTFNNVTAGHTITATFVKADTQLSLVDVKSSDWYFDAVEYVVFNGLMNGTGENYFSPKGDTTRGMIVTILYRQAGSPPVSSDGNTWYSDARVWAMEMGISDGTEMENNTTREQLATMLHRYAKLMGMDVTKTAKLDSFNDADKVSSYAVEALEWATGNGIVTGKPGGMLEPKAGANRAEAAAMLMRFCENFAK